MLLELLITGLSSLVIMVGTEVSHIQSFNFDSKAIEKGVSVKRASKTLSGWFMHFPVSTSAKVQSQTSDVNTTQSQLFRVYY